MPNQYTKLRDARQNAHPIEFKFRSYGAKKPAKVRRQRRSTAPGRDSACRCRSSCQCRGHARGKLSTLSSYVPSGGLRNDPFNTHAVKLDARELAILDHFFYVLSPNNIAPSPFASRTGHSDPHVNLLLPCTMKESAVFDALLAACQASMALSSGLSVHQDRYFIGRRGRALSYLRNKVNTGIDRNAMLVVSMLLICDHLTGDLRSVLNHTIALSRMTAMGVTEKVQTPLDRFVKAGVIGFQAVGAMVTGQVIDKTISQQSCHLDDIVDVSQDLVYSVPPFAPEASEKWSMLPEGICELILSSQLSTQLCAILEEVNKLDDLCIETLAQHIEATCFIQAALQRFSQHTSATYLERCVAAGLWCWTVQHPRVQTPNLFHDAVIQGFSRLFSVAYQPSSNTERDVIIWSHMCMQGFAALRPVKVSESKECFHSIMNRFIVMHDWQKIERILGRFHHTQPSLKRWEWSYRLFMEYSRSTRNSPPQKSSISSLSEQYPDSQATLVTEEPQAGCPVSGFRKAARSSVVCPFASPSG